MSEEREMTLDDLLRDNARLRDVLLRFPEGMTLDIVLSEIVTHYPDDPYAVFLTSELSGALRESPDPRDATIARLTGELEAALREIEQQMKRRDHWRNSCNIYRAERDSLAASLEGKDAEIATFQEMMLDCETEGDKARAELSELRARVEAAVKSCEETRGERGEIMDVCPAFETMAPSGHCSCYYDDKVEDPDGLWQKCCQCGQRQHAGIHPRMAELSGADTREGPDE